jgi:HSP20 family protein
MFNLIPFGLRTTNRWPDLFNDDFFKTNWDSFKTDISETESNYMIEADLPGFTKDQIEVAFQEGNLTISAKRDEVTEETQGNYLRKERRAGQLFRTFVFDNVDTDNIKADYKDGVLKIDLPKKEVTPTEIRKIEIN